MWRAARQRTETVAFFTRCSKSSPKSFLVLPAPVREVAAQAHLVRDVPLGLHADAGHEHEARGDVLERRHVAPEGRGNGGLAGGRPRVGDAPRGARVVALGEVIVAPACVVDAAVEARRPGHDPPPLHADARPGRRRCRRAARPPRSCWDSFRARRAPPRRSGSPARSRTKGPPRPRASRGRSRREGPCARTRRQRARRAAASSPSSSRPHWPGPSCVVTRSGLASLDVGEAARAPCSGCSVRSPVRRGVTAQSQAARPM